MYHLLHLPQVKNVNSNHVVVLVVSLLLMTSAGEDVSMEQRPGVGAPGAPEAPLEVVIAFLAFLLVILTTQDGPRRAIIVSLDTHRTGAAPDPAGTDDSIRIKP